MRIQIIDGAINGYLDIEGKNPAMLNMSINDIKDVTKLSGSYSNTLTIENTKEAQRILGHIFSVAVSIENGIFFDTRKKIKCLLVDDGAVFKDDMNLQMKDIKVSGTTIIKYMVEVYDDKADLFNGINNRYLTDLDFSDGDHVLTRELIEDTFVNTSDDSVFKYHLTTTNGIEYAVNQFKPAIWGKEYLRRIGAEAGIQLTVQDNELVKFDKYLLPCTRQNFKTGAEPIVIQSTDTDTQTFEILNTNANTYQVTPIQGKKITFEDEDFDPEGMYNDSTGAFEPIVNFPAGQAINFRIDFTAELEIENVSNYDLEQVATNSGIVRNDLLAMRFYLKKNTTQAVAIASKDSGAWIEIDRTDTIDALDTLSVGSGSGSIIMSAGDMLSTDDIFQYFAAVYTPSGRWNKWIRSTGQEVAVKYKVKITEAKLTIEANTAGGFYIGNRIKLNDFIPEKVKQSDFIKAVTTLNNMWVIREADKSFKLIRREEYLANGDVKDWSDKLDHDNYTISNISELTNKSFVFTYKDDKDTLNQAYKDVTNETYGQFTFNFDSEHVRGEKKTEIQFSPTPMHETNFSAIVPALDGVEPKHNPRILLDGGVLPCSPYNIKVGNSDYIISEYPHVSHLDHPTAPNLDLNFGVAQYYFYPQTRLTQNNMFNLNWRGVCNQINRGRILKGNFNLTLNDIYNFKFSDKIFCLGQYWHVNSIKANLNKEAGESNYLAIVELVTAQETEKVESEIKTTGGIKPPIPQPPTRPTPTPRSGGLNGDLAEWTRNSGRKTNTFLGNAGIIAVYGNGNTIQEGVNNAIVLGNNLTVTENGFFMNNFGIREDGTFIPPYRSIVAGTNVVLNFGGASVPFQAVSAGVDVVLDFGGTKTFTSTEGLKVIHKMTTGDGGFNVAPNEDYEAFEDWEDYDLGVGEIGINIDQKKIYISDGTDIIELL